MKLCRRCGLERDESDFGSDKSRPGGKQYYCRFCRSEFSKQTYRADPAARAKKIAEWRAKNQHRTPAYWRQSRYKLSERDYQKLLAVQGGGCAVCGSTERLSVDHDHGCCSGNTSCGKCVRGILCSTCNTALGHASDSIERLRMLISYLEGSRGLTDVPGVRVAS